MPSARALTSHTAMSTPAMASMITPRRRLSSGCGTPRSSAGRAREPLYIFSKIRSENIGSSPRHSGASSCATVAATMGSAPSAAPMPVRPVSVSTRISVASLFTFGPRSVRWRFAPGTGADIAMAVTLTIFIGTFLPSRRPLRGTVGGIPPTGKAPRHRPRPQHGDARRHLVPRHHPQRFNRLVHGSSRPGAAHRGSHMLPRARSAALWQPPRRLHGFITTGEDKSRATWQDTTIMRQLLLLRHAKSSWDDAAIPDRDRPLNARGRRCAAVMRQAMRDLGLTPDVVLVSTSRRTLETLEALEPWDETPLIDPLDSLYLADPMQLLAALHSVPETVRSVMVVGHNPGLHDLALSLAGPHAGTEAE